MDSMFYIWVSGTDFGFYIRCCVKLINVIVKSVHLACKKKEK